MDRKLSTMMMLGSTMCDFNPDTYLRKDAERFCGCAIGMACLAAGEETGNRRSQIFPWITVNADRPMHEHQTFDSLISSKFREVCISESPVKAFEALADWVRSVEPACGECNYFSCVCSPVAAEEAVTEAVA